MVRLTVAYEIPEPQGGLVYFFCTSLYFHHDSDDIYILAESQQIFIQAYTSNWN